MERNTELSLLNLPLPAELKMDILSHFFLSLQNNTTKTQRALSAVDIVKGGKVRDVNLGNWLVVERWMKPGLFDGIAPIQICSTEQMFVSDL
ncbi:hypothetical protein C5167_036487 [Papaver somniferum]|uniref:Uncharacterized protein n=1 Tax=Papaver somniferum TaxID=3469 RepID=A0A4Y7I7Q1_PAPSO|nr:hypothetical protein C5167_036487 [Papaver somniferum]